MSGERTRRYHALLLAAVTPPTGRVVLVNGLEVWAETASGPVFLSTQRYWPDVSHPDGAQRISGFDLDPWPTWRFRLPGNVVIQEILASDAGTLIRWRLEGPGACTLSVRPLLSGRDYHALHRVNPVFDFAAAERPGAVTWQPYKSMPAITARGNFGYRHAPDWYHQFVYAEEQARGLDCVEDLAAPGILSWDLAAGPATLLLTTGNNASDHSDVIETERRRRVSRPQRDRAAGQYIVRRGAGRSVIAGYPWFTDWGRDTFIAMRGLMLATGRVAEAGQVLGTWAGAVSEGMLPNRFPDRGDAPEYNAVDASLWFVVAASEYLDRVPGDAPLLRPAIEAILVGYEAGTRFGIGADGDGLLRAGRPGVALTWMDARLGEWVVTPRIGKPVEVQALWVNALHVGAGFAPRWAELEARAHAAVLARFPDQQTGGLVDVIDVDGVSGAVDRSVRPNQVFAAGGLPLNLLDADATRRMLALVEAKLLTPIGLRTLDPAAPEYIGCYRGGPASRDAAYHQGTVWPWLMGPFVQAWLRARGFTPAALDEARTRFLAPLLAHLQVAGLGHVSEVADGDPPHRPGGCPFQAWSLGELIRIESWLDSPTRPSF
ncbi:MAG: amylo-alpha-1,6-glucosidase [Acetobacteraceae bacterium]